MSGTGHLTTPGGTRAAVEPWAGTLAALTPELASALGPLLRRLDALIGEREPVAEAQGEPDGFGGLARSGPLERLLPSEWLLAEEFPEEFLRRYTEHELLHLAAELRSTTSRGRVVALVEAGPAQAGAGRLVQLAALLVLHRRAAARGGELVVGVLGDEPGRLFGGEPAELLPRWLNARRPTDPSAEDVRRAEDALDAADRAWLLASPRLAAELPARPRTLTAEEAGWSAEGVGRVRVRVDGGADAELTLPPAPIAVRALRGAEFRRARAATTETSAPLPVTGGALPVFTSGTRELLLRGADASVLVAVKLVCDGSVESSGRPRRHVLRGPVVAAAQHGRRLLVLCVVRGRLVLEVIGRPVPDPDGYAVDAAAVGLPPAGSAAFAELTDQPVLPVLREDDGLLLPVAGRWRRIAPGGVVTEDGPVASTAGGRPFRWAREPRLSAVPLPPAAADAAHVVHGAGLVGWSADGREWRLDHERIGPRSIVLRDEGAEVIGLTQEGGEPVLITRTGAAGLVRAVRADGVRTHTGLSGGAGTPAVHPKLPLIVAEPRPGALVVADTVTGRRHFTIRSSE
ncbi:hypothetical protein [Streptomyces sp. Y1]|uniref:Uncharacterized protein n=1 Tax=Streptomyces sp. Y1 TaxID=3238634 RepID=A0AB39T977_9ACTN